MKELTFEQASEVSGGETVIVPDPPVEIIWISTRPDLSGLGGGGSDGEVPPGLRRQAEDSAPVPVW